MLNLQLDVGQVALLVDVLNVHVGHLKDDMEFCEQNMREARTDIDFDIWSDMLIRRRDEEEGARRLLVLLGDGNVS